MNIARSPRRLAAIGAALTLALGVPAQGTCNPQLTMRGVPCICNTVTFVLNNTAGCHDCLTLSLDPTPLTLPGGLTLPGSPPYFVLYSAISNGNSVEYQLPIPCNPELVGQEVVAVNASFGLSGPVVLSAPVQFTVCGGQIGDTVFCDRNGNGRQDPEDPPLANVTVRLECDNNVVATTTTDSNGRYLFDRLPIGNCRVFVEPVNLEHRKVVGVNCPAEVRVNLATTPTYLDADFCYRDCQPCDGKVTRLRLQYLGMVANANIVVRDKGNNLLFDGIVQPGESFAFAGVRSDGTMDTEIKIRLNGGPEFKIHTSCSQPIGPGMTFGDYHVVAGESRYGGPLCEPSPCERGKPCELTLRYTGSSCAATVHGMDPSKVTCSGDPGMASPVRIRLSNKENPTASDAKVWFDGMVELGATLAARSGNANETRLENTTWAHVFDASGALLQTISFHTSCSQPIQRGDRYGSLLLEGYRAEGECTTGGGNPNLCNGRPAGLRLQYTGQDCTATFHAQDPTKVSCSGDPGMAATVVIRMSDKVSPTDPNAKVWFTGIVGLNGEFQALAANNPGSTTLSSDSFVHVFDAAGTVLQTIKFHTSCSQPLRANDQFGSIRLLGLIY